MTSPSLTPRSERVPFSRAVVVTPLDESKPELTVVGANLSKTGMFVKATERLEPGTKVAIALEAKGQAFAFAEAEVVWERPADNATDEVIPGMGLRFVNFLHPRAPELVDALLAKAAKNAEKPDKKKAELEEFAAPPEKFTELSLDDVSLAAAQQPAVEDAPPIPRRTKTDPEFVKSGESFVIDLQKEAPGGGLDDDGDAPARALKSGWPRLMAAVAMAPLFLVPLGVAIGTWKASTSPENGHVEASATPTETRTVEFAAPEQKQLEAPAPELMADDAPSKVEEIALVALVETPKVKQLQARVEKPAPKKSSATLPLELAALKSLSASMSDGTVELSLAGASSVRRAFVLKNPERLVIDVAGATPPKSAVHEFTAISGIQRVRIGALPDGVRLVLDLSKRASNVQLKGTTISATLH